MRAMTSMLIRFGQASSHSPCHEQLPNDSASICSTIPATLRLRSAWPGGRSPRWAIFAPVNNAAEALGQAATQAPHPIQAAASMAASALYFGTEDAFASGAAPVGAMIKPPAPIMRSKALRSTTRSFSTGNARARQGSIASSAPSV